MNEIRKATSSDAPVILSILLTCAEWLASKGMTHWKRAHFRLETVLSALEKDEVFLVLENGVAVGTITVGKNPPPYYDSPAPASWAESPAFCLKKLAVLPNHHSKGLATQLINFVEKKAEKERVKFLRLDSITNFKDLTVFYTKRGFCICGKGVTKAGNEITFFEKKLVA